MPMETGGKIADRGLDFQGDQSDAKKGDAKKGSGRFLLVLLPALRGVAAEVEGA